MMCCFSGDQGRSRAVRRCRREEAGRGDERVGLSGDQCVGEGWGLAAGDREALGDYSADGGEGLGVGYVAEASGGELA